MLSNRAMTQPPSVGCKDRVVASDPRAAHPSDKRQYTTMRDGTLASRITPQAESPPHQPAAPTPTTTNRTTSVGAHHDHRAAAMCCAVCAVQAIRGLAVPAIRKRGRHALYPHAHNPQPGSRYGRMTHRRVGSRRRPRASRQHRPRSRPEITPSP